MRKLIVGLLALAVGALAGCAGTVGLRSPLVTTSSQPAAVAQVVTMTPAPAQTVLPSASQPVKKPNEYASLQPFKKFKKGEGEGVAREYKPRTKAHIIALLRDAKLAKREMRVTCDVLVRQMAEAHPGLPFEGCEGTAAAIASDDYQVVACKDELFQRNNWLTVTNAKGSVWGAWHRKCLPGEKVLTYKGVPLISTTCLNVALPIAQVPPPKETVIAPPPVFATGVCPNGYTLLPNVWSLATLPDGLRKEADKLITAAEKRDSKEATLISAYRPDAFSRTLGKPLREGVKTLASITVDLPIRYLDPQTAKVVRELGVVHIVRGAGSFHFSDDPRAYIVETIWPPDFRSPVLSGGERRLWLFGYEWKDFCSMYEHGAVTAVSP